MEVLAYLLTDALVESPETATHGRTRILLGVRKSEEGDEEHLRLFSNILLGLEREEVFNALHTSLPFMWYEDQIYDTVNPFGDFRQTQYRALWTFDIQNDVLLHTNCDHRGQMPLSLLRERAVSMADIKTFGGPIPDALSLESEWDPEMPYWKPIIVLDDRLRAFAHRLLRDFNHQWRHILRDSFNFTTLRVLARAIILLSTLDFEIRENTGGHGLRGAHVWSTQLPLWKPFQTEVVRAGNVYVVLCQDISEGLSTAKRHLLSRGFNTTERHDVAGDAEIQTDYMILSVKHIMLCHATGPSSFTNTFPEPLFNGDYGCGSPSELALDYLIWATSSARPMIVTPLQSLPVEVQDMMLNYVSIGTVAAARFGCLLGLGSPFSWSDGPLKVTLEERYVIRPSGSSVESQVWFDKHKSGINYLARAR